MFRILISVDPAQWQTQKGQSILERANYIIFSNPAPPPSSKIESSQNIIDSLLLPYMYMIIISLSLTDPLGVTVRLGVICERERGREGERICRVILLQCLD